MKFARRSVSQYFGVGVIVLIGVSACEAVLDNPVQSAPIASEPVAGKTLYGFTPFPYDMTIEAVDNTYRLADEYGTLYVQHRDNGIPWQEALEGKPFPKKVRDDWADFARRRPAGKKAYLGLAPLSQDRVSLINASEGSITPQSFFKKPLDHADVKRAYLNYVLRAIENFNPDYLNIGIESGELAAREPKNWSKFIALYDHVRNGVKQQYPNIKIGISFGLQSLMDPDVAERARGLIESSDYLCLSFYPYMSRFHERMGADPLAAPPDEWRGPLNWVRNYTDTPIALCETGYNSAQSTLKAYDLTLPGSPEWQADYVRDLGRFADRDKYLFVIWFTPVDYQKLWEKLGATDGIHKLWEFNGFMDQNMNPKPAWSVWQDVVAGKSRGSVPARTSAAGSAAAGAAAAGSVAAGAVPQIGTVRIGFVGDQDLFTGSESDRVVLDRNGPRGESKSMRWSFDYQGGRFQWALKQVPKGALAGTSSTRLWLKSDRKGPILLQLTESSGEPFFVVLQAQSNWSEIAISLSDFQVDGEKARDGKLQIDQVTNILIADPGAVTEGMNGSRQVWIAEWSFK